MLMMLNVTINFGQILMWDCVTCFAYFADMLGFQFCEAGLQGGSSSDKSLADELEAKYGSFLRRFRDHQFLHLGASFWILALSSVMMMMMMILQDFEM